MIRNKGLGRARFPLHGMAAALAIGWAGSAMAIELDTGNPDLRMRWDNTVRCLDVDNARKVLYDAFKDVLYVDDKQIFRDAAERMEPDGREACVVVTVTEYQREANPQLAFGELQIGRASCRERVSSPV